MPSYFSSHVINKDDCELRLARNPDIGKTIKMRIFA
jgi:hypothetical protein